MRSIAARFSLVAVLALTACAHEDHGGEPALASPEIAQALRANKHDVELCREQQAQQDPTAQGVVRVKLRVLPNGSTADVATAPGPLGESPLASCLTDAVRRWRFPQFRGEAFAVAFPVKTVDRGPGR